MHNRYGFSEVAFSEWLESVRKDVECAFGILKIRFRFLRGFVLYQKPEIIENAFKTAAMLHNMLLEWDGLNDFHWENIDPDGEMEDDDLMEDYNGELISVEESLVRDERGHGGYMLHVNATTRMDCYCNCMNFRCKASKANSSSRAYNTVTQCGAVTNARIVLSTSTSGVVRVRLQATKNIPMHTEIITNYGQGFRYPIPHNDINNEDIA
jgi:hypothetical protein